MENEIEIGRTKMNSVHSDTKLGKQLNWSDVELKNGVYQISDPKAMLQQESLYTKVREREGRLYSDRLVQKLPLISRDDPYYEEWELRLIAVMRLHKYLLEKQQSLKILDLGCGNAWMANLMTQVHHSKVVGVDINKVELEQAARLFGDNPNLTLAYCNILKDDLPEADFDIILLAATIQYFPNLDELINKLMDYLSEDGEIHIIDSPVYSDDQTGNAQDRSIAYYKNLELPDMANFYNHHTRGELKNFNHQILYDPRTLINKLRRMILSSADSPFPWIRIQKEKSGL